MRGTSFSQKLYFTPPSALYLLLNGGDALIKRATPFGRVRELLESFSQLSGASKAEVERISMFGVVERIFIFFSNSTNGWVVFVESLVSL